MSNLGADKTAENARAGLRIDKWLWFVRFFKTRGLATAAVKGGHVRINGERGKPGSRVVVGDRIDVVRNQLRYAVTVSSLPRRRGSASDAALAYQESDESMAAREAKIEAIRSDRHQMAVTPGRPDKRTRRALRNRNRE